MHGANSVRAVSSLAYDLRRTAGYLVADRRGRIVGRVECPMYGTAPDVPDALSVRSGFLSRRRRLVPAEAIDLIDGQSGVIGLSVEREKIRRFLYHPPSCEKCSGLGHFSHARNRTARGVVPFQNDTGLP